MTINTNEINQKKKYSQSVHRHEHALQKQHQHGPDRANLPWQPSWKRIQAHPDELRWSCTTGRESEPPPKECFPCLSSAGPLEATCTVRNQGRSRCRSQA